ncbi:MAG TPA: hypothetical protein VN932_12790 [Rhizomicrobium sp.]|nr:hypothetical protein [Rhizomicrobium sp.]
MIRILAGLLALMLSVPAQAATAPPYNPPFGAWIVTPDQFGIAPFNATLLNLAQPQTTPATLLATLDAARAARMHIFIAIARAPVDAGANTVAVWKAEYDAWCQQGPGGRRCVNLESYVRDGTLLGVHLSEYSRDPSPFRAHSGATLDDTLQIARYVKTLWPYLPIAIDSSHPCILKQQRWSRADVDLVMITFFTERQANFARGEAMIDEDVSCTRQMGLDYTLGINPFGGVQNGLSGTSLASFRHYTEFALLYPGKQATLIWRWWPNADSNVTNGVQTFANFWSESLNPGVGNVLRELAGCAAHPASASCPAGGRSR